MRVSDMGIFTCMSVLMIGPAVAQSSHSASPVQAEPQIDYSGFVKLSAELEEYRNSRLVSLSRFQQIARQSGAIILDTRSARAFAEGHIKGAINLPFSDFTEDKLASVIGEKSRPILIYCNNNFSDNRFPIALKRAPLALNIPTFINLYGYGYKNIYELDGVMSVAEPQVRWTGHRFSLVSTPNFSEDEQRAN
ncbi:rhodanese-like domain-containing protein [Parasphingorhabdus halotolerans]|uniref:Rhodanese-like domain-containing protein n=1 Tax=Parasphingorhabdus halotolerans TaxID=2725558 RepID=A0A6H2DMR2_9SPHN|nr:rhodanese-like domain-containing protein [Parasphingorhabdus halotolerans]QJB69245.1 rhodanese-like domain-containing protein [Parasphingorhabdus halotolerans]